MNFRASSTFRAGDFSRLESLLVPRITAAVTQGAKAVFDESQNLVPVDTGELKASGSTSVEWTGKKVTGYVVYTAGHAAYLEFGTGIRGAASPGAGPYAYRSDWPGIPAQPYIRPALDSQHAAILDAFGEAGFNV